MNPVICPICAPELFDGREPKPAARFCREHVEYFGAFVFCLQDARAPRRVPAPTLSLGRLLALSHPTWGIA